MSHLPPHSKDSLVYERKHDYIIQYKMTRKKFILSKTELDYFLKLNGNFSSLTCRVNEQGNFKTHREFKFDSSGKIKSEIGYQSGWSAYPPGTTPPPPIQYLRKYSYENNQLKLIIEEDNKSNEQLKTYIFNYQEGRLFEIVETNEQNKDSLPKSTIYEYDSQGLLSAEQNYYSSAGEVKTYMSSEISRNNDGQIIKITNSNTAELKGKLITKEVISTKDIEYEGQTITKTHTSPKHTISYKTTAILLDSDTDKIQTIIHPIGLGDRIEYEYDSYGQMVKKKISCIKNQGITEVFLYT